MKMKENIAVRKLGFIFLYPYHNPHVTNPARNKKKIIVPELKGSPIELTKNISNFPAQLTMPGIMRKRITANKRNEPIKAMRIPHSAFEEKVPFLMHTIVNGIVTKSQIAIMPFTGKTTAANSDKMAMVCTTPHTVAFFDSLK